MPTTRFEGSCLFLARGEIHAQVGPFVQLKGLGATLQSRVMFHRCVGPFPPSSVPSRHAGEASRRLLERLLQFLATLVERGANHLHHQPPVARPFLIVGRHAQQPRMNLGHGREGMRRHALTQIGIEIQGHDHAE